MSEFHTKQKEDAKKAIGELMDALNIMGGKKDIVEGIIEELGCTHRTLQQNFWRVMVEVIKEYAEFRSDLRNEASVELCKFFKEKLAENEEKTYLPFV